MDADSVDLMEFVLTIEDEFGISSDEEKSIISKSVTNVLAIIKNKNIRKATC